MLIGDILRTQAEQHPERIALVFGERTWTYVQLNAEVNSLANGLLATGIARGDRVAVLGRNSDRYVVIYFALAKLGAIMVPINAWFKTDEIRYVVEQSQSSVLLFESAFADRVTPLGLRKCVYFDENEAAHLAGHWLLTRLPPPTEPPVAVDERDPHIILYTSGTTGFPKGATLTHRAHVRHAQALAAATAQREGDRAPIIYPLFHTGGPDCVLLPHFLHGGTCVVLDGGDPIKLLDAVARHQLTSIFCVPTVWRRILRALNDYPSSLLPHLSSVHRCLGSSDTFPPALLNELLDAFPHADFYQTYGLTEAGCLLTVCKLTRDDRTRLDSVGRALPGVEVRIVDEHDRELPFGEVGEVVARGETMMTGYWNDEARTAEALRDGWLNTGDLAHLSADGYLTIAGRAKDVIISGGENIYSAEVERVLKQHSAVRDCAVVGVPDAEWGESVLAVVVRAEGARLTADEVIQFVRARLAGFKRPRYVEFIDQLPATTATGKLQRAELRRRFAAQYASDASLTTGA